MSRVHLRLSIVSLLSVCVASAAPVVAEKPGAAPTKPRVAVAIVIDQLAAWIADERLPVLPAGGGFARVRREGTWVRASMYEHALTETAPAHASLYTGVTPREHGIVANDLFDSAWKRTAAMIEDPDTKLAGADGPIENRSGVSQKRLHAKTLGQRLLERDPDATIVSLSIKDRGAIFAAPAKGHSTVLWYDSVSGTIVTSTAFGDAIPAWARKLDAPVPAKIDWQLGDDADFVKSHAAVPDDQDGESEDLGTRSFPHQFVPTSRSFRATPDADTFLVNLALAAIDDACGPAACKLEHPFLLAISLSANDYIGHRFGPDSWEAWDELVRLDRELARLFRGLDEKFGADGYSVVLSADHGVAPLPETFDRGTPSSCAAGAANPYEKPCSKGVRLSGSDLLRKLNAAIAAALGEERGPLVKAVVDSFVFLDHERIEPLHVTKRVLLDKTIRQTLMAEPGVAMLVPLTAFGAKCPALAPGSDGSAIRALICRSTEHPARRIGDYYIVQKAGSYFSGPPDMAGHGSPYRYDRAVPLLVRYPGVKGGREIPETTFRSFTASLWYALTGEKELGGVRAVGVP